MRTTVAALATLLTAASLASAAPAPAPAPAPDAIHLQLPFGYQRFDIKVPDWFHQPSAQDVCPDLTVYCVKDGETVGDLGKKPFEWNGTKLCQMKDPKKNTAECNVRFPDKCLAQCEARGPLGGH